jgi:glycosyltransferase involved in cell wall biosynthesis
MKQWSKGRALSANVMFDEPGLEAGGTPSIAISVVCPFFNEQAILEAAVRRMLVNLRAQIKLPWEIILVDDGSRDESLPRLLGVLRAEDACVRVLSLPTNQGRGRALKAGIDAARGEIIVTTEVDCSWGDDIVERLSDVLRTKPDTDFVVASPHLPGGGLVNVTPSRVFLTRTGNRLIRLFFASKVTMNTGMTRAYRRGVIQPLVVHEQGKEFHLEVLLKLLTLGFKAREIPATITWQEHKLARAGSENRKSSTNIIKTINSHLRFIAIAQPVRYFAWLAVTALFGGAGFMFAAIWNLLTGGPAVFLALIGLMLFMFCLLFVGFSVVFFQLREVMREEWMQSYASPLPPSAREAMQVFPR